MQEEPRDCQMLLGKIKISQNKKNALTLAFNQEEFVPFITIPNLTASPKFALSPFHSCNFLKSPWTGAAPIFSSKLIHERVTPLQYASFGENHVTPTYESIVNWGERKKGDKSMGAVSEIINKDHERLCNLSKLEKSHDRISESFDRSTSIWIWLAIRQRMSMNTHTHICMEGENGEGRDGGPCKRGRWLWDQQLEPRAGSHFGFWFLSAFLLWGSIFCFTLVMAFSKCQVTRLIPPCQWRSLSVGARIYWMPFLVIC